jgi:hypothetical protein
VHHGATNLSLVLAELRILPKLLHLAHFHDCLLKSYMLSFSLTWAGNPAANAATSKVKGDTINAPFVNACTNEVLQTWLIIAVNSNIQHEVLHSCFWQIHIIFAARCCSHS